MQFMEYIHDYSFKLFRELQDLSKECIGLSFLVFPTNEFERCLSTMNMQLDAC
jgi:hypothetical protein